MVDTFRAFARGADEEAGRTLVNIGAPRLGLRRSKNRTRWYRWRSKKLKLAS